MAANTPMYSPEYLAEYNGNGTIIFCSIFIPLLVLIVLFRFIARLYSKTRIGIDDWLSIPAMLGGIGVAAVSLGKRIFFKISHLHEQRKKKQYLIFITAMIPYAGAGRHVAYLMMTDPNKVAIFVQLTLPWATFYLLGVTFPKLAMLFMYLRIFVDQYQRRACYIIMVILVATAVGDIVANFLQCIPLNYLWDKTVPGGHCFDQNAFWRWATFPNIVTDVFMIVLPIPAVYKIQLSWKDKIGVLLTFLTGGM
jgi:hypothetical protein